MPQQWEYAVDRRHGADIVIDRLTDSLNYHGSANWELVHVSRDEEGFLLIYKRPKS